MSAVIRLADRVKAFEIVSEARESHSPEQLHFFRLCIIRATHLWFGYIDEEFVGMWGIIPPTFLHTCAYIWLYHTDSVKGREFLFIRKSRIAMAEVLALYPEIHGHTVATEASAIRWLRWLGAEFADPEGLLIPFVIRRP